MSDIAERLREPKPGMSITETMKKAADLIERQAAEITSLEAEAKRDVKINEHQEQPSDDPAKS